MLQCVTWEWEHAFISQTIILKLINNKQGNAYPPSLLHMYLLLIVLLLLLLLLSSI